MRTLLRAMLPKGAKQACSKGTESGTGTTSFVPTRIVSPWPVALTAVSDALANLQVLHGGMFFCDNPGARITEHGVFAELGFDFGENVLSGPCTLRTFQIFASWEGLSATARSTPS